MSEEIQGAATVEVNGTLYVSSKSLSDIFVPLVEGLNVLLAHLGETESKPRKKRTRRTKAQIAQEAGLKTPMTGGILGSMNTKYPPEQGPESPSNPGALAVDKKSKKGKVWAE